MSSHAVISEGPPRGRPTRALRSSVVAACLVLFGALPIGDAAATERRPACGPRDVAVDYLAADFGEAPIGQGRANNGATIELLTSVDGATWTLLITTVDGRACMIAAGDAWHALGVPSASIDVAPGSADASGTPEGESLTIIQ